MVGDNVQGARTIGRGGAPSWGGATPLTPQLATQAMVTSLAVSFTNPPPLPHLEPLLLLLEEQLLAGLVLAPPNLLCWSRY